ncbi:ATP-dependent Clp protease ATP-binding subunit [uncultured Alistipes sp.]|uniref:ATP-dependent Clp protease ATP-binding subunit n=1 Tax=uncultured Alistipes sp. TaxID=538949 RepID=UPI00266C68A5|nr:ATP-dependent Clp protease ATP-binding subunit [uncultured Alistipes sp.]
MQLKISKTLEGLIARSAFNTTKAGITHSLKDFLALELLREEGSLAFQLLSARLRDWELHQVRLRIEHEIHTVKRQESRNASDAFYRGFAEELRATSDAVRSVTTGHALLSIAGDRTTATAHVLEMYGITPQIIAEELQRFAAGDDFGTEITVGKPGLKTAERSFEEPSGHPLAQFGADLTQLARDGKVDPVIGRDREIDRVIQILSRRKKNNPILIGEAGVGKSAIVEGLALRIARGEVPATIAGKRIFSLDVSALVAGTKFRGEFEERMQQLLDLLRRSRDTIVFIDEIHTIVGAGSTQGSLDTANILKPALARGELQTIGATTLDEYRTDIESDTALERRFQRVLVEPTTPEQTLGILRRIAPDYERHHRVRYSDEALRACVELTGRYVTGRCFPDKAIDALDEAGSRAHLQRDAATATVEIGEGLVRRVVSDMTGIPAERVSEDEASRLRSLRDHLARRVVGQQEAVERIARTIRRSRAGLQDENRPIGVFLFVGPTGVGKTLLAKEVSKWLFDEHRGLIRIDMSEYAEKHNVARLIGPPPGYVGYGEGGQLTEAVRRQPYAVVLLDEIEKAHPEVFNTLLQLFDEGRLTDGSGRTVDFRNTILIMTSNVGSREVARKPLRVGYATPSKGAAPDTTPDGEYRRALERVFAPEFLNRIDDIVIFRTLDAGDVVRIIDLELQGLFTRTGRLGYKIKVTEGAKRRLASMGYEARYGVRSLRRTLAEQVEEPLSTLILDGKLRTGDTVVVESDRSRGIRLRVDRPAA